MSRTDRRGTSVRAGRNAEACVFVEAFFPERVFAFGQWCEGHRLPGRWIRRECRSEILEFARKVKEAGGLFYLGSNRYEYENTNGFERIEARGYVNPVAAQRLLVEGQRAQQEYAALCSRKAAAGEPGAARATAAAEGAERLYVLVTRKVSPTGETNDAGTAPRAVGPCGG